MEEQTFTILKNRGNGHQDSYRGGGNSHQGQL